jgi:geranylgeranyl diphosphate synthase type II
MTRAREEQRYTDLRRLIDRTLGRVARPRGSDDLAEACTYVLAGGGKRLRAVLVLLSCEAAGGRPRDALHAGSALEIMHNFTLVHDDIMDHAPSRRGRPTVHTRWDLNNALLAGDVLLGFAYRELLKSRTPHVDHLVSLFTDGLIEVCEGQALDLAFERRARVTVPDYFRMIEKKTGRLLSMAMEMGALIAGATPSQTRALREFGHYLGRAFQLQDDLLDVVARQDEFGKIIGGDIMEGKKTYLLLTAARRARGVDRSLVRALLRHGGRGVGPRRSVVPEVTALYRRCGVLEAAERLIRQNTERATAALAPLPASRARATLAWLARALVHRSS